MDANRRTDRDDRPACWDDHRENLQRPVFEEVSQGESKIDVIQTLRDLCCSYSSQETV